MCVYVCLYLSTYVYVCVHVFKVCSLRGPWSSDTPIAINEIQLLASEYLSPLKGTRVPWKNSSFQGWDREGKRRA